MTTEHYKPKGDILLSGSHYESNSGGHRDSWESIKLVVIDGGSLALVEEFGESNSIRPSEQDFLRSRYEISIGTLIDLIRKHGRVASKPKPTKKKPALKTFKKLTKKKKFARVSK